MVSAQKVSAPMAEEAEMDSSLGLLDGEEIIMTAGGDPKSKDAGKTDFSGVTIRKNLQETAFFFPQLQTR